MFHVRHWREALAASALFLWGGIAGANQSNTWSPTTGTVSGLQLTTNYNNAFSAVQSCNSGASAPTNDQTLAPVTGQCWLNTSTSPFTVEKYDGTQWTTVGWLDATNHQWISNVAGLTQSVASAGTTDLCSTSGTLTPSPNITVTGGATVNGFGSNCAAGTLKFVTFSGTPTLVHNGASFILPNGGFNINAAAGDSLAAYAIGGGNWRVITYQQANGLGGVPSGVEVPFAGINAPAGWTMEYGQAISRTTNASLFNAITLNVTGTPGNGSSTINNVSVDLRNLGVEGAFLEGTGIPIGNYVISVTAATIVMNANATGGSGGETIRILPWGQGDASTTFNVPDRRGIVIAGRDNMGGTAANRLSLAQSQGILGTKLGAGVAGGNIGGEQGHTQLLAEIATHTHTVNDSGHSHTPTYNNIQGALGSGGALAGGGASGLANVNLSIGSNTTGITNANAGSSTPFNNVQPTGVTNYVIKN